MIRCYERTKQTLEYIAKELSKKMGLREHYAADATARNFVEKLDWDMLKLKEFTREGAATSVEQFIREKIEETRGSFGHLRGSGGFFKFLKYVTVKMIRGSEARNRWIEYADLRDEPSYARDLDEMISKGIQQKILVKHKNSIRFRLNSIFQAFMTMG